MLSALIRRGDQDEIISELSDWDRLISVDSGSWLVHILKKHTLPMFAKLTHDNFYDLCYANDPVCILIVTNQEPIALRYFEGYFRFTVLSDSGPYHWYRSSRLDPTIGFFISRVANTNRLGPFSRTG
jgi:hypothetical protein